MQTQTIENIHVKIQCENEFRRFVLNEVNYQSLAGMIRTLLGLSPETTFKMSYLDDEGDWVLLTTDCELEYACTLSKSPLKISVKICTPAPVAHCCAKTVCSADEATPSVTDVEKPWRMRGGRGRGGCRGGRMAKGEGCAERFDSKIARLTERHAVLTAKLIEGDLSEERARALEWRLSHLQNKIDTWKVKKQQLSDASAVPKEDHHTTAHDDVDVPVPAPAEDANAATDEPQHPHCFGRGRGGRGCHRGGQRGGWRKQMEGHEEHQGERHGRGCGPHIALACSTPEGKAAFERLQAAKEAVHTARQEKAGKEAIQPKLEALKEAKAEWREIKMALWKEKRAAGTCPRKEAK